MRAPASAIQSSGPPSGPRPSTDAAIGPRRRPVDDRASSGPTSRRTAGRLAVVLGLLLVQAIGNLYLPDLNGDIINNGVVTGDTRLHPPGRRAHAPDHRRRRRRRDRRRLLSARRSRTASPGTSAARSSRAVETFGQVEVNQFGPASLITRNTNDVQQVQQVVFMGLTIMVSAPILIVGGIFMALRTDVPLSGLLSSSSR